MSDTAERGNCCTEHVPMEKSETDHRKLSPHLRIAEVDFLKPSRTMEKRRTIDVPRRQQDPSPDEIPVWERDFPGGD